MASELLEVVRERVCQRKDQIKRRVKKNYVIFTQKTKHIITPADGRVIVLETEHFKTPGACRVKLSGRLKCYQREARCILWPNEQRSWRPDTACAAAPSRQQGACD